MVFFLSFIFKRLSACTRWKRYKKKHKAIGKKKKTLSSALSLSLHLGDLNAKQKYKKKLIVHSSTCGSKVLLTFKYSDQDISLRYEFDHVKVLFNI